MSKNIKILRKPTVITEKELLQVAKQVEIELWDLHCNEDMDDFLLHNYYGERNNARTCPVNNFLKDKIGLPTWIFVSTHGKNVCLEEIPRDRTVDQPLMTQLCSIRIPKNVLRFINDFDTGELIRIC